MVSSFTTASLLLSMMAVMAAAMNPSEELMGSKHKEKTTHLHFFMHDTVSGRTPSAIKVVSGPSHKSPLINFGDVFVFDDPLTKGKSIRSKLVGRGQGIYSQATQEGFGALLLTMNLVLTEGQYNGSTLAVLGRDAILSPVRELPVVGGTGHFRLAEGYALMKTTWFNNTTGDAILDFDVYVMHY